MRSCEKCAFGRKSRIYAYNESYVCVMCFKNNKIMQYPIINAYKCNTYLYNETWKSNKIAIFDVDKGMCNINTKLLVQNALNRYNKENNSNLIDFNNYKRRRK